MLTYTYAVVSYDAWSEALFGVRLNDLLGLEGNHFDHKLLEWAVAELLGGDLGVDYLGSQGDMWDARRTWPLAGLGAAIGMTATLLVNWRLQRDFNREWTRACESSACSRWARSNWSSELAGSPLRRDYPTAV